MNGLELLDYLDEIRDQLGMNCQVRRRRVAIVYSKVALIVDEKYVLYERLEVLYFANK